MKITISEEELGNTVGYHLLGKILVKNSKIHFSNIIHRQLRYPVTW